MSRIVVAKLVGVFGVRGELKCKPTPAGELSLDRRHLYAFGPSADAETIRLAEIRSHQGRPLVRIAGIETVDAARPFVGRELYLERSEIVLGRGEYLDEDLVGLWLLDPAGHELGRVARVDHYPAQDVLVLVDGGLVPLVKAFVREIDLEAGTIGVSLPEGLLEP